MTFDNVLVFSLSLTWGYDVRREASFEWLADSCSPRTKRILFLAKSARTLTHFIFAINVRNNYVLHSRPNYLHLKLYISLLVTLSMQFTVLYGLHITVNIK